MLSGAAGCHESLPITVTVAEADAPVPPSFEVTALVVLFLVLAVVPTTFSVIAHHPLIDRRPLTSATTPEPAGAVSAPPQVLVKPFGSPTTRPAGSTSVKPTPVSAAVAFGLVSAMVSVVVPVTGMLANPKALAIVGGAIT